MTPKPTDPGPGCPCDLCRQPSTDAQRAQAREIAERIDTVLREYLTAKYCTPAGRAGHSRVDVIAGVILEATATLRDDLARLRQALEEIRDNPELRSRDIRMREVAIKALEASRG